MWVSSWCLRYMFSARLKSFIGHALFSQQLQCQIQLGWQAREAFQRVAVAIVWWMSWMPVMSAVTCHGVSAVTYHEKSPVTSNKDCIDNILFTTYLRATYKQSDISTGYWWQSHVNLTWELLQYHCRWWLHAKIPSFSLEEKTLFIHRLYCLSNHNMGNVASRTCLSLKSIIGDNMFIFVDSMDRAQLITKKHSDAVSKLPDRYAKYMVPVTDTCKPYTKIRSQA